MTEYRVRFEAFDGPLDLLLHLVRKQEVSIYDIDLARVASEFVAYLNAAKELDIDGAGDFLVMAATLVYLKSRELLPEDLKSATAAEDDDGEDPRWELIRRLVEYKKFKDAAQELQGLESRWADVFERRAAQPQATHETGPRRGEVSVFQLIEAVNQILKRFDARHQADLTISPDAFSVSEKIETIRKTLLVRPLIRFSELFLGARVRAEIVATFLAILELTRLRQISINQAEDFGDIEVAAAPLTADAAPLPPWPDELPDATPLASDHPSAEA